MSYVMCHLSFVICHVSHVTCHMIHVACHLSLTPTTTATDPPPANSPTIHSRRVCKDTKTQKNVKTHNNKKHRNGDNQKTSRVMPILAIGSLTRSLQPIGKLAFQFEEGTDIVTSLSHTLRLID